MATLRIDGCDHRVDVLVFDKDGTLFDFAALWGGWADRLLEEVQVTVGPPAAGDRLGAWIGWDPGSRRYDPVGPLAAGSVPDVLGAVATALYRDGVPWHQAKEAVVAARAHADATVDWSRVLHPLPGLADLLRLARDVGLAVGVVTSDDTATARLHLETAGLAGLVGAVVGDDIVTVGKPGPEPVQAACRMLGVEPGRAALFGDTAGDVRCGRRAGVRVVVGVAASPQLAAPLAGADHVVADFRALRLRP